MQAIDPAPRKSLADTLPADAAAIAFLLLTWATQSYLLLRFVLEMGVNVPHYDEWELVPVLSGHEPISLSWLWSLHNEHRVPIPKLVYLLVQALGDHDFRSGMVFDVLVLSLTAAACCWLLRRWRGHSTFADAFFPFAMLHWGHAETLAWSFQLMLVVGVIITMVALLSIISAARPSPRAALVLGLCAVAMPLNGGNGLAMVPGLALGTGLCAWQLRQQPENRAVGLRVAGLGLLSLLLTVAYFIGYVRPTKHPVSPNVQATLEGAAQFLSLSLGSGQTAYWPLGAIVLGLLALAALIALCSYVARVPAERLRALRLLLFFGSMICLALGVAHARAAVYPHGLFVTRYVALAMPFACALYLVWELRPSQLTRFMQMLMFTIAALLVIRNRDDGYLEAAAARAPRQAFRDDIDRAVPISVLAQRHCNNMYYVCQGTVFQERLRMLRALGIAGFAKLPD